MHHFGKVAQIKMQQFTYLKTSIIYCLKQISCFYSMALLVKYLAVTHSLGRDLKHFNLVDELEGYDPFSFIPA